MKTIISKYWLVLMVLVSMTLLSACSSDDDATSNPVFPQVQTIAGNAGDEFDFTFEANENWSLACHLVQDGSGRRRQGSLCAEWHSRQADHQGEAY